MGAGMGEAKRARRKEICAVGKVKDRQCQRVALHLGNKHVTRRGPGTGSCEGCVWILEILKSDCT